MVTQVGSRGEERLATVSSGVAFVLIVAFGAAALWIAGLFGGDVRSGAFLNLIPMAVLYAFLVGSLATRSRSDLAVPAFGAVLPAIAATVLLVREPYTWRDVAAPLVAGAVALVATWAAQSLLRKSPRVAGVSLISVLVTVITVVLFLLANILVLTTGASPAI